jgi:dTDP-4-amino-4,6-dideoxy-D-galactose acyltransferase
VLVAERGSSLCSYLDWDSEFFGVKIARLIPDSLTNTLLDRALSWCRAEKVRCLYFLARIDDEETILLAERNAFQLVDVRITMERSLPAPNYSTGPVRPFRSGDLEALRAIAATSHRDTRFYHDSHFPKQLCSALYQTWLEKSCAGYADAVLVAETNGSAVGYVSCHLSGERYGSIGLAAVAEEARGRGLGGELVNAALSYFQEKGMTRATVVTQGRNFSAQRLYQACGFVTQCMQLWYHCWLPAESIDLR